MEIAVTLLFEGNVERLDVKFAARIYIADDRPKTRDEQNSDFPIPCIASPLRTVKAAPAATIPAISSLLVMVKR